MKQQIIDLLAEVAPADAENASQMMAQFKGKEEVLLQTLLAAQGRKVSESISMSSDTHGMSLSLSPYGAAGYEYGNGNNAGNGLAGGERFGALNSPPSSMRSFGGGDCDDSSIVDMHMEDGVVSYNSNSDRSGVGGAMQSYSLIG